jgi:hypothetical protein
MSPLYTEILLVGLSHNTTTTKTTTHTPSIRPGGVPISMVLSFPAAVVPLLLVVAVVVVAAGPQQPSERYVPGRVHARRYEVRFFLFNEDKEEPERPRNRRSFVSHRGTAS